MRRTLVLVPAALLALAACSSSSPKLANPSTANSGGARAGTQGTIPPAPATSGDVTTPDGNHYTLTITPATTGTSGCTTQTPVAGRYSIPFTVVQKNDGSKQAPEYRMRFDIDDPDSAGGQEVVAIKLINTCVDYTAPGNTLPASGTVSYSGVANNVSNQAKLKVTVIGTPNSEPLGTVEAPLAAK